jgi:hypothetical protein
VAAGCGLEIVWLGGGQEFRERPAGRGRSGEPSIDVVGKRAQLQESVAVADEDAFAGSRKL